MDGSSELLKNLLEAMGEILGALDRCEQNEYASIVDELTEEIELNARAAFAAVNAASGTPKPRRVHASEETVEGGWVLPKGEAIREMAREATPVVAGQVLKAPNGCIYAVKFQNGVLSLTPAHDEHGQLLCVPKS